MSVSFYPEPTFTGRQAVVEYSYDGEDVVVEVFDSYAAMQDGIAPYCHPDGYLVGDYGIRAEVVDPDAPEVNMANSNAQSVLLAMDLDPEGLCGSEDGARFYERVLIALATDRLDEAVPPMQMNLHDGKASVFYGGRRAGYITERLEQLLQIAEYARDRSLPVVWA